MNNTRSQQVAYSLSLQNLRLLAGDERPLRECLQLEGVAEDDLGSATVAELGLSVRSFNWLTRNGVWTVRDLLQTSPSRLMQIRNFGIGSLADVVERMRTTLDEWISKPETAKSLSADADAGLDQLAEGVPIDSLAHQLGYTAARLSLADRVPLETLNLTIRAYNCAKKKRIRTAGELARWSEEALMAVRNMGRKSLADIKDRLDGLRCDGLVSPHGSIMEKRVRKPPAVDGRSMGTRSGQSSARGGVRAVRNWRTLALSVEPLAQLLPHGDILQEDLNRARLSDLDLSIRTFNCLRKTGIETLSKLIRQSPSDLMQIRYFGIGCLADVVERLEVFVSRLRALDIESIRYLHSASESGLTCTLADEMGLAAEWIGVAGSIPVEWLGLPGEVHTSLCQHEIATLADLVRVSRSHLFGICDFRRHCVEQIVDRVRLLNRANPVLDGEPSVGGQRSTNGLFDWSSLHSVVDSYLARLGVDERDAEVILGRYGLDGRKPAKLHELAVSLGVSDARVGQIENRLIRKLSSPERAQLLRPLWDTLEQRLSECGGTAAAWCVSLAIGARFGWRDVKPSAVVGLARLQGQVAVDRNRPLLGSSDENAQPCRTCLERAKDLLATHGGEMHVLDLAKHALEWSGNGSSEVGELSEEIAHHFARLSKDIVIDGGKAYLRDRWEIARGRSLRQVTKACLSRLGKPVHYRDLAEYIREVNTRFANCTDDQVHGCLGGLPGCVVVGRGTYALADWGFSRYKSHGEAIIELLVNAEKPLARAGVIAELSRQGFSEWNLRGAIDQHPRIVEIGNGLIDLKERTDTQELALTADDLVVLTDDEHQSTLSTESVPKMPAIAAEGPAEDPYSATDEPSEIRRLRELVCERMKASYKPVLFLSIIECVDENGSADLGEVTKHFAEFYRARHGAGLPIERGNRAVAHLCSGTVDLQRARQIVSRHPLRLFLQSGLFQRSGDAIRFAASTWRAIQRFGVRSLVDQTHNTIRAYFREVES